MTFNEVAFAYGGALAVAYLGHCDGSAFCTQLCIGLLGAAALAAILTGSVYMLHH